MSKKIRAAVIGCGSWAREAHLPALAQHPQADIVALVDPDMQARTEAAQLFNVAQTYSDAKDLYAQQDVDVVVVATPHSAHFGSACDALNAGAHVLIEKPMVLDPEDGQRLMRLAADRGKEIIVGYPLHYNEQALQLRSAIADGKLGKLEFVSCLFASLVRDYYGGDTSTYQSEFNFVRAPRNETYSDPVLSGGGQGQTQVTHSAALLFWLTGLQPQSVTAFCENFSLPVDLVDAAAVRFAGGTLGTIGSTGGRPPSGVDLLEIRVFGSAGAIFFDVFEGNAVLKVGSRTETFRVIDAADRYPLLSPARNLVDVALGVHPNGSAAAIGQLTASFLHAMYESAAKDGMPTEIMRQPLGL